MSYLLLHDGGKLLLSDGAGMLLSGEASNPLVTENLWSLIGFGLPFRINLPVPDGSLSQGDRQHLVGLYAGVLAGELIATYPPFSDVYTLQGPQRSAHKLNGPRRAAYVLQ